MSRVRIEVTAELRVLSPLHIGSGMDRTVDEVLGAAGENKPSRVAAIQRDADNRPWLPGSTIKGLLRRLGRGEEIDTLVGAETLVNGLPVFRRGALIVSGASLHQPSHATSLPYADRDADAGRGALGPGVFVAAGTRIDRSTGVADASSLRHDESVAPGAVFPLTLTIEMRGVDAERKCDEQLQVLLELLATLGREAGWPIGAGQADGDGRVQLRNGKVSIAKTVLGEDGRMQSRPCKVGLPTLPAPDPAIRRWALRLDCEGPFAVLDPSWAQQRQSGDQSAALSAQRIGEKEPVLPGASVAGALRARAAWLAACDARRAGKEPVRDDPSKTYERAKRLNYSSVERLFGLSGWRGLLEIEVLKMLRPAAPWQVSSVKLDRFSGGPMSGGLFETAAFLGVQALLVLRLRRVPSGDVPTEADVALAERLIEDLCTNGIMLGHGSNKGFGWFAVTKEQTDAAS
jgi:CRISPR/Cas system CSM-associated protein Csm3 (group 7 of RAMP superfamily)